MKLAATKFGERILRPTGALELMTDLGEAARLASGPHGAHAGWRQPGADPGRGSGLQAAPARDRGRRCAAGPIRVELLGPGWRSCVPRRARRGSRSQVRLASHRAQRRADQRQPDGVHGAVQPVRGRVRGRIAEAHPAAGRARVHRLCGRRPVRRHAGGSTRGHRGTPRRLLQVPRAVRGTRGHRGRRRHLRVPTDEPFRQRAHARRTATPGRTGARPRQFRSSSTPRTASLSPASSSWSPACSGTTTRCCA